MHVPKTAADVDDLPQPRAERLRDEAAELPNFVSISPFQVFNPAAYAPGFLGPRLSALSFLTTLHLPYIGEEGVYTVTSLEMWAKRDFLVPTLYGAAYGRPPLYNWLIIPVANLLGWDHMLAAARLVAASASVPTGLVLAWLARNLGGTRTLAALSALIYLSGDVLFYHGWLAYSDPLFGLFVFTSIACLWVALHQDRPILTADDDANTVAEWTTSGKLVRQIAARLGKGKGRLDEPRDADTDSHGDIYVADFANDRMAKFGPGGKWLRNWGTKGAANGQFARPYGVAVDATDHRHRAIADRLAGPVQARDVEPRTVGAHAAQLVQVRAADEGASPRAGEHDGAQRPVVGELDERLGQLDDQRRRQAVELTRVVDRDMADAPGLAILELHMHGRVGHCHLP
jgi:hypothetical protein